MHNGAAVEAEDVADGEDGREGLDMRKKKSRGKDRRHQCVEIKSWKATIPVEIEASYRCSCGKRVNLVLSNRQTMRDFGVW